MKKAATLILSNWHTRTMQRLCDGLDLLLDNVGETLVDFAAKSESTELQTAFFDAQHLLAMQGDAILRGFRDELTQAEQNPFGTRPTPGDETLSLLERDAYERSVALETIANNCILRNQQNFHALKQRLSAIYGGKKFQVDTLPLNPKRVASSFEKAVDPLDIPSKVLLILFTLFDRYVMSEMDLAMSEINHELADAGILPTVKYTIVGSKDRQGPARRNSPRRAPAPGSADSDLSDYEDPPSYFEGDAPGGIDAPSAEQTMRAITDLVSAKRRRERYKELNYNPSDYPPISPAESQRRALSALESPQVLRQAPNPAAQLLSTRDNKVIVDKDLLLKVRNTLKKQREIINSLMGGAKNVGEREQNAIDIVGMLFEAILDDQTLPPQLKTLLSHLHTPYLKIAVSDPSFLNDAQHPARHLLDQMLQLGMRWLDPERLRSGIYPTLQYCVRKILDSNGKPDYEHLEGELMRKASQLEQAKKVSEKRTLEAEKGKTMLARARETAESATQTLLQTRGLPSGVRIFFQTIFTDYLSLLLLRNDLNPQHINCKASLDAAVRLIEAVDAGNMDEARSAGTQLQELIMLLLPHYQDKIDLFLRNLGKDSGTDTQAPETTATSAKQKDKPLDEAQARRILEIPVGTWFSLQKTPAEQPLMVKLLWANPHTQHALFVDQHGLKRARLSLREAVQRLDDGSLQQIRVRPEGVFAQLLGAIKKRLESAPATGTPQ
jgi:hypothetical protein